MLVTQFTHFDVISSAMFRDKDVLNLTQIIPIHLKNKDSSYGLKQNKKNILHVTYILTLKEVGIYLEVLTTVMYNLQKL